MYLSFIPWQNTYDLSHAVLFLAIHVLLPSLYICKFPLRSFDVSSLSLTFITANVSLFIASFSSINLFFYYQLHLFCSPLFYIIFLYHLVIPLPLRTPHLSHNIYYPFSSFLPYLAEIMFHLWMSLDIFSHVVSFSVSLSFLSLPLLSLTWYAHAIWYFWNFDYLPRGYLRID